MQYADFVALVERQIKSFNDALGESAAAKHLTAEARLADMREKGWGTMDAVAVMDAADFRDCGFPPGMAKLLVSEVQKATAALAPKPAESPTLPNPFAPGHLAQPTRLVLQNERDTLEASSDTDLLTGYDPANPGTRGEVLDARAKGRAFLFFVGTKLAVAESAERLKALRENTPVTPTVTIEGIPRKPLRVGDPVAPQKLKANPLRPGEALAMPGEVCTYTGESYTGIGSPVRSFLLFCVSRGAIRFESPEIARMIIETARKPDALAVLMQRYAVAAADFNALDERERPSDEIAAAELRPEGRRGFPFPEQPAVGWPAGNAVRIFLYAAEDAAKWVSRLNTHLATLRANGQATTWHMGMVGPGQNAEAVARIMLDDAHVVVVLTSPSMAVRVEDGDPLLDRIDNMANDAGLRVVPVRAIPSAMRLDARDGRMIERVTSYPRSARALSLAANADEVLTEVAVDLGRLCDVLAGRTDAAGRKPKASVNTLNIADMPRMANALAIFEALCGLLPSTDAVRKFAWAHFKLDLSDYRYANARQAVGHLCEDRSQEGVFREALMWRLCNILSASFDNVVVRTGVKPAYLSGVQAPQGVRASDLIRAMEPRENGLLTLAAAIVPEL